MSMHAGPIFLLLADGCDAWLVFIVLPTIRPPSLRADDPSLLTLMQLVKMRNKWLIPTDRSFDK